MKKTVLFIIINCQLSIINSHAQNQHLIDSLETKLKQLQAEKHELRKDVASINDTTEAKILGKLSGEYDNNNHDKAIDYANQSMALSIQISYKKGVINAYHSLGNINFKNGSFLPALEFYKKELEMHITINNKKGIAECYNSFGNVYWYKGNYPEALKNYFVALKKREEMGNEKGNAGTYNNIAVINLYQSNYSEALKYYKKALKMNEETGNKRWQAVNLYGMSGVYSSLGNYEEAIKVSFKFLKINEELGDKNGIAHYYGGIAGVYQKQGNYKEALKNQLIALKMLEEIGYKDAIADTYNAIGVIYTKQKNFKEASEYLNKGLLLAKQIGSLEMLKNTYKYLSVLDSAQGNYNKALEHYKLYITYRDSITNTENTKKTVALQMNYEFNKKQTADSIKSSEEKKVISAELKQEETKSYALYGGLALMIIVASVFFKQRNKISKEKKRSDDLLLNILPAEVADELKETGGAKAKQFDNVSVLFTDFVGFTVISENLSPTELVEEIHHCFTSFDEIIERNGLEKIKTIGDAYLAVCGMPMEDKDHAKKAVLAAIEIMEFINKREIEGGKFKLRIGINSGPVVAGIVGVKKFAYDIWGDTVNTAARMEQHSTNGKINISGATYELVKNQFNCIHRGKIEAKNKGEVDMYFVNEL